MQLNEQEKYDAFHLMEAIGGGFASRLAQAWFYADSRNRALIEHAFNPLLWKFHDMNKRRNSNDTED